MREKGKRWLKAAGVRAVKTVAQTFVAIIGTAAVMGEVNWQMVLSTSVLAGNLSVESCGNVFQNKNRQVSPNYEIGTDGRVGLYVEEENRAWTSSSRVKPAFFVVI